ncbi:hypothetical protein BDQ17DRAFT_1326984 [Cyathus striatus]|nr:hypothetical protein BDQ17DRAFT_1326984 [Cyathus striatus]
MSMLEPFDAQMLDYPSDLDVPMHSSSSDSWFHAEAAMDDTTTPLNALTQRQALHDSSQLGVEVDMDAYEEVLDQSSEYEMADDIQDSPAELLDVEVYDASLAQSPLPNPDDSSYTPQDTNQVSYENFIEQSTRLTRRFSADIPLADSDTTSEHQIPQVSLDDASSDEKLGSNRDSQEDRSHDQLQLQETEESGEQTLASPPPIPDYSGDSPVKPTAHVVGEEVTRVENEQNVENDGDQSGSQIHASTDTTLASVLHTSLDRASDVKNVIDNAQNLLNSAALQDPNQDSFAEESRTLELANVTSEKRSSEYTADGENREGAEDELVAVEDDHQGTSTESEDREDLVDTAESAQVVVEVSLFNEPSTSGPSISHAEPESHLQTAHVLLQNFPTLYYEPISSVFEALRQDDYITNISEYVDSELVLDAYDLQLVISEDNIFAREVSLHDLNTLHDASGIAGPLRLRMQTIAPRFIVRFHLLQEHAARLQETTSEDDSSLTPGKSDRILLQSHAEGTREELSLPENSFDADEVRHLAEAADPDFSEDVEAATLESDSEIDGTRLVFNELHKTLHDSGAVGVRAQESTAEMPTQASDTTKHRSPRGHEDESSKHNISRAKDGEIVANDKHVSELSSAYDENEDPESLYLDGTAGDANTVSGADNYNEDDWDDDDAEGDLETVSGTENEADVISNESSVTLSSKASKRSFDEADLEHGDATGSLSLPSSPGKRLRVE